MELINPLSPFAKQQTRCETPRRSQFAPPRPAPPWLAVPAPCSDSALALSAAAPQPPRASLSPLTPSLAVGVAHAIIFFVVAGRTAAMPAPPWSACSRPSRAAPKEPLGVPCPRVCPSLPLPPPAAVLPESARSPPSLGCRRCGCSWPGRLWSPPVEPSAPASSSCAGAPRSQLHHCQPPACHRRPALASSGRPPALFSAEEGRA